jgi:hypothetical protein
MAMEHTTKSAQYKETNWSCVEVEGGDEDLRFNISMVQRQFITHTEKNRY